MDLSFISNTTWKIISICLLVSLLCSISVGALKSCNSTKLDNKRLEEINRLNEDISNIKQENINLENRILGLQSEIEHQNSIIISKNAEIDSLVNLQKDYEQAICKQNSITTQINEIVENDNSSKEWFDQKIPDSLFEVLFTLGVDYSVDADDVCM